MTSVQADGQKTAWTYTDDNGSDYLVAIKTVTATTSGNAAKIGGAAGTATLDEMPNELRPRAVKCVDATGYARYVICYTTAATLWTTPGTTIVLIKNGEDTTFTSTKTKRPEKLGRVGRNPVGA